MFVLDLNRFIISDIMTKDLVSIGPKATIVEAAGIMNENHIRSIVIKDKNEIVGILTDRDLARIIAETDDIKNILVRELMSVDLVTIPPSLSLQESAEVIRKNNVRHLLVKNRDGFVGIVSVKDILSTLYEELKDQDRQLKRKISELEKFYKVAIDRELVMVRLKKRVNELEKKVGESTDISKYILDDAEEAFRS